jgi:hypothetical protein
MQCFRTRAPIEQQLIALPLYVWEEKTHPVNFLGSIFWWHVLVSLTIHYDRA